MKTHFLTDTAALTGRSMRHVFRSPDTIITTAVMPIAIMLLFVYVFGGAVNTGEEQGSRHYINYVLPGVLLITVAMGITYTSYRLYLDLQSGIFDRFHSMPIARSAVLWAHVLTSFVANGFSVLLVSVVAFALGFRSDAGANGLLAVAGILGLVIIALTWLAVVSGLAARSVDGASAGLQPIIFLPFISSAFVPTESMPGPVKWFAEHQPMTSIVNALRDLLMHNVVSNDIWIALGWCTAILIGAYAAALALYRRKIS